MKKLNLDVIRLDGETQPREKLNDERVDLYAENMKDGDKFPPITVHHDGSNYWLSSGFHRYFAAKKVGYASFECEIILGTLEDAKIYACGANAKSSLTPTDADNRRSVITLLTLETSKYWTLREIASHVGVSHMTVSRVKASLQPQEEAKKKTPERKDAKPVDAAKDTNQTKDKPKQEEPPVQPAAEPEGDERDHRIAELMDTVTELNAENQRLKDVIATAQWDASDIEKIDVQDTLNDLREQIRVMEIDNAALRDSRDMFQTRNAELMKSVKSLQSKLKKLEAA